MLASLTDLLNGIIDSPWVLLAVPVVSTVDAFFPPVPSDAVNIAAAAAGHNLGWVIGLAAIGAFLGDHISYALGRFVGTPAARRGGAAHTWAQQVLHRRGGIIIVGFRFLPFGRIAATMTAGALRYPLPRFAAFDALAAVCWAGYCGLIGYFAGRIFDDNPLLAVVLGIAVSVVLSVVVESIRLVVRRRNRTSGAAAAGGGR